MAVHRQAGVVRKDFGNMRSTGKIETLGAQFQAGIQSLIEGAARIQRQFDETMITLRPVILEIKNNLERLPERSIHLQRLLAERGWFVSSNLPISPILGLDGVFAANRSDVVDDFMSRLVEQHLEGIEAELESNYPARAPIFREAFVAHQAGKYILSIPVFLAQADGICIDLLGKKFFSKESNSDAPVTRKAVESLSVEWFADVLLEPLKTRGGMSANQREESLYPDVLNRHRVLHGIDTAYSSKLNSLKAISLVGYLGGLAHKIISDAKITGRD
jgi:hypothetical protein